MKRSPYSPDIVIFLLLIPFISAFNYYLTYSNIKFGWFLLLTFSIDTIQGYCAWWGARAFILYLDTRWPYERQTLRRIIFQLIMITLIGLLIISALTELTSWIAKGKPAPLNFYTIDLVIISIWFFVINGIYVGLHYYNEWRASEALREEENRIKSGGLLVRQGRSDIRLPFEDVTGFYVEGEYAVAVDRSNRKYYMDESLDKIERTLPQVYFFRLNRQYLLHRQVITGFKRVENGKLQVLVNHHDTLPAEITVSRTKASAFRGWFDPE